MTSKIDKTGITENKLTNLTPNKKEFIELYRTTHGHISDTARAIGVARQTFYDWINNDEEFRNLILEADSELNDEMRQVLIDKAGDGDLGAVIFYLRKRHPDFKDNYNIQANTQINAEKILIMPSELITKYDISSKSEDSSQ